MSLFHRFRKRAAEKKMEAENTQLSQKLAELVLDTLRDSDGRISVEDAICSAATIVGERCIDAANDFPLRDHEYSPGQRVFSTKVNELICGDVGELELIPEDTIIGVLRRKLDGQVYKIDEFPLMSEI